MKINFYTAKNYTYIQKPQAVQSQPAFGSARTRKLVEEIKQAKNLRYINATFKDMVAVYNELGFDVILKGGSHAVIPLTDRVNLPLIIPHCEKYVHPLDVKRLQCVLNGEIERALYI